MIDTTTGTTFRREFSTMAELWDHVTPKMTGYQRAQFGHCSMGTCDWPTALRLGRDGWADGSARIKTMAARISERIGSKVLRQEMRPALAGDFPDVAAYLSGVPENMYEIVEHEAAGAGRIVKITVGLFVSSAVGAKVYERRGAAILALVDALGLAGHLSEIVGIHDLHDGGWDAHIVIPIKRSDEPLSIERAAFALAHPATYRRIGFNLIERLPDGLDRKFGAGSWYGHKGDSFPKGDIHFPGCSMYKSEWRDEASAEQHILGQLQKLGILQD